MSERPAPRPALRKAPDGTVHPAAPRVSSLAVAQDAVEAAARAGRRERKDDKRGPDKGAKGKSDDRVELAVPVPKTVRKRLRQKASAHGWTAEEAASHVLRAWVDD